jgi:hypothetical protein
MASIWGFLNNPVKDVQKTLQVAEDLKKADRAERLELYKLMVEMADRVSQRRQVANSFYLSINTLLVGGSAYLGTTTASARTTLLISIAGVLVCTYWVKAIESYKTLNTAKFSIINEIETSLVIKPFTDEWSRLDPDGDGKRHKTLPRNRKVCSACVCGNVCVPSYCIDPLGFNLAVVFF